MNQVALTTLLLHLRLPQQRKVPLLQYLPLGEQPTLVVS